MRALIVKPETGAESCGESFIDEIGATTTGIIRGIANRALLDRSRGAGDADDKMTEANSVSHLADKRAQHLARDFEVENGAAMNRPVYFNAARLAAQKFECFVTNGNDLTIVAVERHNGG